MQGLLEQADEIIASFSDEPQVLDAALITAVQKVGHDELTEANTGVSA